MKHFSSAVFVRSHNHIIMNSLLTDFRWQKWPERLLRRAMTDRFRRCVTLSGFCLFLFFFSLREEAPALKHGNKGLGELRLGEAKYTPA